MDKCIDHGRNVGGFGYAKTYRNGKSVGLHRVVYCMQNQVTLESIAGLVIRHSCDNPRCINPAHLELGTHKDNSADMQRRGRNGQTRGPARPNAKLTQEQVTWVRSNYIAGDKTFGCRSMARILGVYHAVISRIVREVGY